MKPTFFDFIGAADMERVHSATIAWMISDMCKAITREDRIELLKTLFNADSINIRSIRACNEFNHIDIAFITKDSNGKEEFWAIENKIKAPLGHNQLAEYEETIDRHLKDCNYTKRHLAVLSLIGILPQDKDRLGKWHLATYETLSQKLEEICAKHNEHQHYAIVKEYSECLHNLTCALKGFKDHPKDYPNVFTDGNRPKSDKINIDTDSPLNIRDFISINGLETLFQKYYFVDIVNEISSKIDYKWCHISETHGNADFSFHLGDMGYDSSYPFDLSFQNGTFKFAVTDKSYSPLPDKKDTSKWPPKFVKWISVFDILKKEFPQYKRLNRPKTKIRVSLSHNINNKNCRWYELSRDKFINIVIEQIDIAREMAQKAIEYHEEPDINQDNTQDSPLLI